MLTRAAVIERLASAGCVAAEREADELLAAAPDDATLETWLRRREQGEPPAWITGTTSFCGRPLHVAPGVYVPRAQTEELARRAAALLPASGTAVDLCTGAGAIAAHLRAEVPTATVVGVDIDPLAAACAKRNGVPAIMGDIARPLRTDPRVDLVTAVAPYVPTGAIEFLPADVQAPRAEARARRRGPTAWTSSSGRHGGGRPAGQGRLAPDRGRGRPGRCLRSGARPRGFARVEHWADDDGDLRGLAAQKDSAGGEGQQGPRSA